MRFQGNKKKGLGGDGGRSVQKSDTKGTKGKGWGKSAEKNGCAEEEQKKKKLQAVTRYYQTTNKQVKKDEKL